MGINMQLYNDLLNEVTKLKPGEEFQVGDLCKKISHCNKKDIPSIGKKFKENVLAGNIPSVQHSSLRSNNHNTYEKV